MFNLIFVVFFA